MTDELTKEEAVRVTMKVLGCSEIEARFIIAIERDEIDGDVIEVDEDGKPVRDDDA